MCACVDVYKAQRTECVILNIPEDLNLQQDRCDSLTSYVLSVIRYNSYRINPLDRPCSDLHGRLKKTIDLNPFKPSG